MPPNDPDPMFAAFYERCKCDGRLENCQATTMDEYIDGDCAAWMPAPPPPCIRREASRVYRWLILAAAMALLLVAMANSKGCEGQQTTVKGGSTG